MSNVMYGCDNYYEVETQLVPSIFCQLTRGRRFRVFAANEIVKSFLALHFSIAVKRLDKYWMSHMASA